MTKGSANPPSGRAQAGEYASYAADDVAFVKGDDIVHTLGEQCERVLMTLGGRSDEDVRGLRYAPDKWTLKEVIGHLADDERIFMYRLLCVLRNDVRRLDGFDERDYVAAARFEEQPLAALLDEYRTVRAATVAMLNGLTTEQWARRGTVNGYEASVRGLAYHIAGHELRHLRTIEERYLA
ncbi:MAG TPA: DinB family protein [Gemmatimonadaceae bacterium]|nr:DinB family protein [Gemmatimonadaceae bacterium]